MNIMTKPLPDITNIPSGLKDASSVELLETGCTLYVDNCRKYQRKCRAYLVTIVKPNAFGIEGWKQLTCVPREESST